MFLSISKQDFNNLRREIFKIGDLTPMLDKDENKFFFSTKGEFFGENN